MTPDLNYEDPRLTEVYDLDNPWAEDTEFYLALAGSEPCRVLDLGCGTGTLCCALAERGHRVTGVDPAGPMLAIAATKPHAEKVEWVQCRAQDYRSQHLFDLIVMMGHVFQILLTDEEVLAVLDTMRRRLKPGGRAAFETRNPNLNWSHIWGTHAPVKHMVPGGHLRETIQITSDRGELISFQQHFEFPDVKVASSSTLRFMRRRKVEHLIAQAGLSVRELFGDWDRSRFQAKQSLEMIFVVERLG
jgi:2-polyprenyl-3-methyl-5-hydroxy-6-metoxy-1,4-benzoquinol methylase